MIVCPNCNHQNPDGAVQCEACYTPLPATTTCPNCGATVQTDASFCGQCGYNLRDLAASVAGATLPNPPDLSLPDPSLSAPNLPEPNLLVETPTESSLPEPNLGVTLSGANLSEANLPEANLPELLPPDPLVLPDPLLAGAPASIPAPLPPAPPPPLVIQPDSPTESQSYPDLAPTAGVVPPPIASGPQTQLQRQTARLLHVQTSTGLELPQTLGVIHLGKPNDRIPPDIDVSGFPDSEIVSRIHADIRVEAGAFYIEDVGSSNGTYINNVALPMGNRHRLRPGDRIALGKGDKVTFLFQLS